MLMTIEVTLLLVFLGQVLMLARREEKRPVIAPISSASRCLRRGRRAA